MAKGNRTIDLYEDDLWKRVFFDSVGTYVNVINHELSNEYPLEPLSNYIKIGGGYAFKTSEYKKSGIPIIRISDFNNEQIDISNCVYYDEDDSLAKYELSENDIIICLTGGTIAKLGIVQSGLGKLYMNQRVGRFDILDNSKFEKEYVYWIARSVQSIIKNLAWGAAIPNVSPKQIEKLEFSFPPIKVQQQIIEFLNDLKNNTVQNRTYFNESIERHILELQNNNLALKNVNSELTHQLDLIKQLRQAFLREAMQGKLLTPVTSSGVEKQETGHDLLAKIKTEKAQLIAEKKLKKEKELPPISEDEIPFEIPEHWAWCRMGEIISYTENLDIHKNLTSDTKINYVDIASINNKKYIIEEIKQSTVSELSTRARRVLKKGYIIYSTVRPYLKNIAIINQDLPNFIGSTGFNVFKPIASDINFLFYFLLNPDLNKMYEEMMVGFNSPSITNEQFDNTIFPLPPLHEQEQIVGKLEELMAFCDGLEESIKESQGYNEQLLQQVLREALQGNTIVNE